MDRKAAGLRTELQMTKSIHTLIPDIYKLLGRKDGWFTEDIAKEFGLELGKTLTGQLGETKGPPSLRLSQMGPRCPKALWYSIHHPELAEPIPPWVQVKFAYGHMVEALALALAKAAGHEVTGEQDEVILDGVKGHRDCIIDGCLVDIKSANSRGYIKFKDKTLHENDLFGYLDQLDAYLVASSMDPLLINKDTAYDVPRRTQTTRKTHT